MATLQHSGKVRGLFRAILRATRDWQVPGEGAALREEARAAFRDGRTMEASAAAEALLQGTQRLEVALHYGLAYERPVHLGGGGSEGLAPHKQYSAVAEGRKRVNINGQSQWIQGGGGGGGGARGRSPAAVPTSMYGTKKR